MAALLLMMSLWLQLLIRWALTVIDSSSEGRCLGDQSSPVEVLDG